MKCQELNLTPQKAFIYIYDIIIFSKELPISKIPEFMKEKKEEKEELEISIQNLNQQIKELKNLQKKSKKYKDYQKLQKKCRGITDYLL